MAQHKKIRILVADAHPVLREGVRAFLRAEADLAVVAEAESGEGAIKMFEDHRPDIVLMDLQMPGAGGLAAIKAIRGSHPAARIVVLTSHLGAGRAMQALRAGAAGYVVKSAARDELLAAIRTVYAGGTHLGADVATTIALHVADDVLSGREAEVLTLAASGNSNRQIGERLGLSEGTIKGYMKAIYSKLGASDRTHAVTIAVKRGMITL